MNTNPKVLIVEDERALALAFAAAVRQAGAASELAPSAARARLLLRESGPFHALILDIGLPDENGLAFLRGLPERGRIPTFVVTAHGEIENTIAARKLGVCEFFTKPLDFATFTAALTAVLRSALPAGGPVRPLSGDGAFLGAAPSMRPVFRQIAHACASTEPVLIRGETGTGKTRVARLVHEHSATAEAVWITHSPGEGNLESNLRRARGGSLLIEEMGGLAPEEQGWLVRAMESADGSFPRLMATSSLDLAAAVSGGALRSDLYYRLQVLEIRLPPLRERIEDLPALADFFAGQLAPGRLVEFAQPALARLLGHDWPGNLRELRNVVSFAMTAAAGSGLLESRHLPVHLGMGAGPERDSEGGGSKALRAALSRWIDDRLQVDPRPNYRELSEALESVLIEELLPRYGGRLARLAADLQANRTTLRKRLQGSAETD
jgi:DNA-binding NtrC family response regulator